MNNLSELFLLDIFFVILLNIMNFVIIMTIKHFKPLILVGGDNILRAIVVLVELFWEVSHNYFNKIIKSLLIFLGFSIFLELLLVLVLGLIRAKMNKEFDILFNYYSFVIDDIKRFISRSITLLLMAELFKVQIIISAVWHFHNILMRVK